MKTEIAVVERGYFNMETKRKKFVFAKQIISMLLVFAVLCSFAPLGVSTVSAEDNYSESARASVVSKPTASVKPGMYRSAQQVALTAEAGAKIYYTTNNLMPTVNDTEYTQPITVSKDTNICAIAVKDGVASVPTTFGYFIRTAEEPLTKFVVMSDIEVGEGLNDESNPDRVYALDKNRVFKAMEVMSSICPNPDLLVMNGDLVKNNRSSSNTQYPSKVGDHEAFIKLMKDSMTAAGISQTPVQVTIGNHDSVDHDVANMKAYYDKDEVAKNWFPSDTGYYHKEVNGLDFIYLDSNHTTTAQKTFLSDTLAAIQSEKGANSPIFVFLHIPINGAQDDSSWTCSADWRTILANYPQAIVFSGHTHYSVTEDSSISQEAGFTAVNGGSMSYIERIDKAKEMMWNSTDGTLKRIYQFPSTQGLTVEVYADRVEINRVTVNADRGDVKLNNYVAVEPYDNCGAVAGDTWVIKRGSTTAEWKENFQYEKAQRKANALAPNFAENAKPALSGIERTATVSFPQAENAQKVDKYQIELINQSTGKADKTMKVWSENLTSPMPASLTYNTSGLAGGTAYRAKVTAYNDYGVASEPILSEETYTTPEIPGVKTVALTNESFDEPLDIKDEMEHAAPYISDWSKQETLQGRVDYTDKKAVFVSTSTSTSCDMRIPLQKRPNADRQPGQAGSLTPISEEFFVEYDFKLEEASKGLSYFQHKKTEGGSANNFSGASTKFMTYSPASISWNGKSVSGLDLKNTSARIRIRMGTENGKAYISGVWVNGNKLDDTKVFGDVSDGWTQIQFNENEGTRPSGERRQISVDNFKVWKTGAVQISEFAAAGEDDVTFEQIKGGNTAANNVTENLNLNSLIGTQTKNGLVILGWQSDNENVIATDGTVTRPTFQGNTATVTLTPMLGMVDAMNETGEDYVSAAGKAITLTVPDLGREPLKVAQTGYIADEDYNQALTEGDVATHLIPYVEHYESNNSGTPKIMGTGDVVFKDGKVFFNTTNLGGNKLVVPFQPGVKAAPNPLLGEFYVEFDLDIVTDQALLSYIMNGSGNNAIKFEISSSKIKLSYYEKKADGSTALANSPYGEKYVSGKSHKIKLLLGTEASVLYIGGMWIDGASVKTGRQDITGYTGEKGWHAFTAVPASKWIVGDVCSVDNVKVWRSEEDQAKELAAADDGKITFEQIKGQNISAESVTADLELKSGEAGALQTANKMLVMGWKSNNESVISTSGKVTRPAIEDVTVNLTPILAIQSSDTGKYITTDGEPIAVTVKRQQAGFFDKDSNLVSVLNGNITQGNADISGLSGNVRAYAALYYNNRVEQVWVGEKVTTGGENTSATVAITLPDNLTGRSLKLFVWNADTLTPLTEHPIEVK